MELLVRQCPARAQYEAGARNVIRFPKLPENVCNDDGEEGLMRAICEDRLLLGRMLEWLASQLVGEVGDEQSDRRHFGGRRRESIERVLIELRDERYKAPTDREDPARPAPAPPTDLRRPERPPALSRPKEAARSRDQASRSPASAKASNSTQQQPTIGLVGSPTQTIQRMRRQDTLKRRRLEKERIASEPAVDLAYLNSQVGLISGEPISGSSIVEEEESGAENEDKEGWSGSSGSDSELRSASAAAAIVAPPAGTKDKQVPPQPQQQQQGGAFASYQQSLRGAFAGLVNEVSQLQTRRKRFNFRPFANLSDLVSPFSSPIKRAQANQSAGQQTTAANNAEKSCTNEVISKSSPNPACRAETTHPSDAHQRNNTRCSCLKSSSSNQSFDFEQAKPPPPD